MKQTRKRKLATMILLSGILASNLFLVTVDRLQQTYHDSCNMRDTVQQFKNKVNRYAEKNEEPTTSNKGSLPVMIGLPF